MSTLAGPSDAATALAEFRSAAWKSIFAVSISIFSAALIFSAPLHILGVFDAIAPYLDATRVPAYFFAAATGLVLALTASDIATDEDRDGENDSLTIREAFENAIEKDSIRELMRDHFEHTLEGVAAVTYVATLVALATLFGVLTATHLSPALGVFLCITYPKLDLWWGERVPWILSPTMLVLAVGYLYLYPIAAIGTVMMMAAGLLLGVSIGIPIAIGSFLWEVFKASGLDKAVHRPIDSFRSPRRHH